MLLRKVLKASDSIRTRMLKTIIATEHLPAIRIQRKYNVVSLLI